MEGVLFAIAIAIAVCGSLLLLLINVEAKVSVLMLLHLRLEGLMRSRSDSKSALGVVAIPFGNPKFIGEAIIIELSFITLSVLVRRGYTKALYACIALALTVIIGNSTSPAHIHLMTTFSKPANALILIIGLFLFSPVM